MIDYTWKSKGATGNVRPKQIRPQRDKGLVDPRQTRWFGLAVWHPQGLGFQTKNPNRWVSIQSTGKHSVK